MLQAIVGAPNSTAKELFSALASKQKYKDFYNTLYRLVRQEFVAKNGNGPETKFAITEAGQKLISQFYPERDGVWKIIIFDIPEKKKFIRTILRSRLKALHFKKWQNSIWVSPYRLDKDIEQELNEMAKKFFVRLIKTTDINYTEDLEKMFI